MLLLALGCVSPGPTGAILYVTQVPVARNGDEVRGGGVAGVTGTFGTQSPEVVAAPRGGDLMIRYADGSTRNLTREAGFGEAGSFQGRASIAVREPTVHWDGDRALFSMVIGAPEGPGERLMSHWQIYEVRGLGPGEVADIRHVDGQPEDFDNVSPFYGSDDAILFTSTRPRGGEPWLLPLDEYESSPTVYGIYRLAGGELSLVAHTPSGAFDLALDSFGRLLYTRWDHLQRDQQADNPTAAGRFLPRTLADESEDAAVVEDPDVFPEPRTPDDPSWSPDVTLHGFNHFFPWSVRETGGGEETLLHLGRQDLGGTTQLASFPGDSGLVDGEDKPDLIPRSGIFQLAEDPNEPGTVYGVVAYEYFGAGGGGVVRMVVPPGTQPEGFRIERLTVMDGLDPHTREGTWRDPLPMRDGSVVVSYTSETAPAWNEGSELLPNYSYDWRLYSTVPEGDGLEPDGPLTEGESRELAWWTDAGVVMWSGDLWELQPVEVAPRARPAPEAHHLEAPELRVLSAVGVDPGELYDWLRERDLALIVVRNATQRDRADRLQPYSLRVPGGVDSTVSGLRPYDVAQLQVLEADLIRGYGRLDGDHAPTGGRRAVARPIHGDEIPASEVALGTDGSAVAVVPAGRALTWQLLDPSGVPVVRERYWVTMAPGEVRVCPACHGVNVASQTGAPPPENEPEALRGWIARWAAEER